MPPRRESSSGEQQGGDDEPEPTAGNFQVELDGKPHRQLLLLSDYVTTANVSNATFGWSLLARRATRGGGKGKQPAASAGGGLSKGGAGLGKAKAQPASSGGGMRLWAAAGGWRICERGSRDKSAPGPARCGSASPTGPCSWRA